MELVAVRTDTLAGYIRFAQPLTAPGSLTDEEAQRVAAYINSKERRAFTMKDADHPEGEALVDAVYYPCIPLLRRAYGPSAVRPPGVVVTPVPSGHRRRRPLR
jgi:hypothetical protein